MDLSNDLEHLIAAQPEGARAQMRYAIHLSIGSDSGIGLSLMWHLPGEHFAYCVSSSGWGHFTGHVTEEMDRLIRDAVDLSHIICQACGSDGDMRKSSRHWYRVLRNEHAETDDVLFNEYEAGPVKPSVWLDDRSDYVVTASLAARIRNYLRAEGFIVHDENGLLRLGKGGLAIILDLAIGEYPVIAPGPRRMLMPVHRIVNKAISDHRFANRMS